MLADVIRNLSALGFNDEAERLNRADHTPASIRYHASCIRKTMGPCAPESIANQLGLLIAELDECVEDKRERVIASRLEAEAKLLAARESGCPATAEAWKSAVEAYDEVLEALDRAGREDCNAA